MKLIEDIMPVFLMALWFFVVIIFFDKGYSDKIETQEFKRLVTVQASIDGCPCAYEVWEADITDGTVDQDSWRVIHRQDNCEYEQFITGAEDIIYHNKTY